MGKQDTAGSLPIAPTEEEWRAMTLAERERLLRRVVAALSDRRSVMSERQGHKEAKVLDEVFGSADLIGRLTGMVEDLEAKAEQATAKAEQATAKAEQAVAGLREAVLAVLEARGISCPDETRVALMSCDDAPSLRRWLSRAKAAGSAAEVFCVEAASAEAQR